MHNSETQQIFQYNKFLQKLYSIQDTGIRGLIQTDNNNPRICLNIAIYNLLKLVGFIKDELQDELLEVELQAFLDNHLKIELKTDPELSNDAYCDSLRNEILPQLLTNAGLNSDTETTILNCTEDRGFEFFFVIRLTALHSNHWKMIMTKFYGVMPSILSIYPTLNSIVFPKEDYSLVTKQRPEHYHQKSQALEQEQPQTMQSCERSSSSPRPF